jgi:predicted RNA-binding protein with PUA-like domain
VDLVPLRALRRPVSLAEIKACRELAEIALVRQGRLSVMPLEREHYDRILALGKH